MAGKPKPAPIFEKSRGKYRLHFSYNGRQYRRHLISRQHVANVLQSRVNNRIVEYKAGLLPPPPGMSLEDFIFAVIEDKEAQTNADGIPAMDLTTLTELIDEFQRFSVPPLKAESTCKTEKIHLTHLKKFVESRPTGDPFLEDINIGFFNLYKSYRYAQKIRTDTVKKELGTFQLMFSMAVGCRCTASTSSMAISINRWSSVLAKRTNALPKVGLAIGWRRSNKRSWKFIKPILSFYFKLS